MCLELVLACVRVRLELARWADLWINVDMQL